MTINGNDGISSPRRAACVRHSIRRTISWRKRGCMFASRYSKHTHALSIRMSQFFHNLFFFTHLVFFFFFFFLLLNSSLFSSHVYFYPSVPREESEKWRGLGRLAHLHGNYILQKKPSLSDVAYASALYTFCRPYLIITFVQAPYFTASPLSTCSVELPLFFFFFFFFSLPMHAPSPGSLHAVHPSAAPSPPPLPGADWAVFSSLNQWACCCRVILYKPTPRSWDTVRDAIRFAATVRPTSMRLKKILCGLCSVQGGFPISPPPPPLFTGSCWEMQIYWHPPQSITAVWHPLLKHMLYYWTCMWFD